jgi:hypothetical protein
MATAYRTQRPKKNAQSREKGRSRPVEPEAPDRGMQETEAPEGRLSRRLEAPDAGEGRAHLHETEFTHGRSQS